MKKIFLSAAVLAISAAAFAQKKVDDIAKFTSETINLGKIKQGVPTKGVFTVTNIGNQALIIEQANPTCGCTISDYTKEPIAAGKTGVKHLTVNFAGIDEMKSITLTGDVVSAEEFDKLKPEAKATPASAAVPAKPAKKAKKTK